MVKYPVYSEYYVDEQDPKGYVFVNDAGFWVAQIDDLEFCSFGVLRDAEMEVDRMAEQIVRIYRTWW